MDDMLIHSEMLKLIVAYTLVGAFVFTVLLTVLSLPGWIRFADARQQQKLFGVLVVQLVVGCVGFFLGFLNLSPAGTAERIEQPFSEAAAAALEQSARILERRPIDAESVTAAFALRDIASRLTLSPTAAEGERMRIAEAAGEVAKVGEEFERSALTRPRRVAEAERDLLAARLASLRDPAPELRPVSPEKTLYQLDLLERRLSALNQALEAETPDVVEIAPLRAPDPELLRRLRREALVP